MDVNGDRHTDSFSISLEMHFKISGVTDLVYHIEIIILVIHV